MPATFAQQKAALDDISQVITQRRKVLENLLSEATQSESALTNLATDYSSIVSDIDTNANDNPSNDAYQNQKAEKDLLVSEFQALKTTATALKNAIDGVLNP